MVGVTGTPRAPDHTPDGRDAVTLSTTTTGAVATTGARVAGASAGAGGAVASVVAADGGRVPAA